MVFDNSVGFWMLIFLITLLIILSFVAVGSIGCRILGRCEESFLGTYAWGLVFLFAVEETLYVPCMLLKIGFDVFSILFGGAYLLFIAIGIILIVKEKYITQWIKTNKSIECILCNIFTIALFIAASYMIVSQNWETTYDDKYYLGKAGEILKSHNMTPSFSEAANGLSEMGSLKRADVSCLIVFFSFISQITSIHHVIVARVIFSIVVILFGISIIHLFGRELSYSSKRLLWFDFFTLSVLLYFKSTPTYQAETSWATHPWYGSPVMAFIICLFILMIFRLNESKESIDDRRFWISLLVINMAMLQTEIVAIFMIPCMLIMYGLTYLVLNHEKITRVVIINSMIPILPVVLCGIYVAYTIYVNNDISGQGRGYDYTRVVYDSFLWGGKNVYVYFGVFVIAYIYIWFFAGSSLKRTFVYPCFTFGLTFANPLLFSFITRYVTTEAVYYRLFFCIPVFLIISIAFTDLFFRKGIIYKIVIAGSIFMVVLLNIHRSVNLPKINNPYKATDDGIQLVNMLLANKESDTVQVVAPGDIGTDLRIYSTDITYTCSDYSSNSIIPKTQITYKELYQHVYDEKIETAQILIELGTDYVIYPMDAVLTDEYQEYCLINCGNYNVIDLKHKKE